jgi:hypothetical protein
MVASFVRSINSWRMGSKWEKTTTASQSKSSNKRCADLKHCLHWLHLEPTHLMQFVQHLRIPVVLAAASAASENAAHLLTHLRMGVV